MFGRWDGEGNDGGERRRRRGGEGEFIERASNGEVNSSSKVLIYAIHL